MKLASIITTIQPPTPAVHELTTRLERHNVPLIVIGDSQGPEVFKAAGSEFFSIKSQGKIGFTLSSLLPFDHYSRKNLGYLIAIKRGAGCLYETDDDNAPTDNWLLRSETTSAREIDVDSWFNAYSLFSDELIWPRGYPLNQIRKPFHKASYEQIELSEMRAPIQQGLANNSPDVDAIWRLLGDRQFEFTDAQSACLRPGTWCPFNSQNTWWWPIAFPLMYLPSFCSFRMTDIWRSFIAQRCLWELGFGVVFHSADVVQERNFHNLMTDFNDEIPGYQHNSEIADRLTRLPLESGAENVGKNLLSCYKEMTKANFIPSKELPLVESWLFDLNSMPKTT